MNNVVYAAAVRSQSSPQQRDFGFKIADDVKIFFGVGKEIKRYGVVVGSYQDRKKFYEYADKAEK